MAGVSFKNAGLNADGFAALEKCVQKKMEERGCFGAPDILVSIALNSARKEDEYCVTATADGVEIVTGGLSGAFAATGDYLRRCDFDGKGGFVPYAGSFELKPSNPIHGMYFASHFCNFYEVAPMEEVYGIIEDLALRGCNTLTAWYDMHQYDDVDTPESRAMIDRLTRIYNHATLVGMKNVLLLLSNESFRTSDPAMRAEWAVQNGYFATPVGHYHLEICPNKEGGLKEILRQRRSVMEAFRDVQIDYIAIWPYDQGGCTCSKCAPWGSNGFLKTMDALHELLKEMRPDAKLLCSTWYFDHFVKDEWKTFIEKMDTGAYDYVDYLFGYFANDEPIPESMREGRMPGGKRMISFPEISMWGATPWGGFGANPMPERMENNFRNSGRMYCGTLPYSEGIFEDINKAMMTAFYAGRTDSADEVLREYARFELCLHGEAVEDFVTMIHYMEETLPRESQNDDNEPLAWRDGGCTYEEVRFVIANPGRVGEVKALADRLNAEMAEGIRSNWRWRIIWLRAGIDYELSSNNMHFTSRLEEYMNELVKIYHAEKAYTVVSPLTRACIRDVLGGVV